MEKRSALNILSDHKSFPPYVLDQDLISSSSSSSSSSQQVLERTILSIFDVIHDEKRLTKKLLAAALGVVRLRANTR